LNILILILKGKKWKKWKKLKQINNKKREVLETSLMEVIDIIFDNDLENIIFNKDSFCFDCGNIYYENKKMFNNNGHLCFGDFLNPRTASIREANLALIEAKEILNDFLDEQLEED